MFKDLKIAIVYDWIDKWGGVERILLHFNNLFPKAHFFTSYYDKKKTPWADHLLVRMSFINKLPSFIKESRIMSLPFYPFAFESFDFREYDFVLSVTSSFAKGVITHPGQPHLCYLLTPTRYLWIMPDIYQSPWTRFFGRPFTNHLKKWDSIAAMRPDRIVSISKTVSERCRLFYKRSSEVIYPPFPMADWENIKKSQMKNVEDKKTIYYLVVSRLEKYKKIDIVVEAFNKLPKKKLVIVGTGHELKTLKRMARGNIVFHEFVSDEKLAGLYSQAEATIIPQEEDFGYVSIEAQFFGCPVIAFNKGGATETIVNDKAGIFFDKQTPSSLTDALERFHTMSYNLRTRVQLEGPKRAVGFADEQFDAKFGQIIKEMLEKENKSI